MATRSKLHVATKFILFIVGGLAVVALFGSPQEPAFITRTFYLWVNEADYPFLNWIEFALFVGCTLFVVEGFQRRSDNLWQFTLQELLIFTTAVAMTTAVLVNEARLFAEAQKAYQETLASGSYFSWDGPPIFPLVNSALCVPLGFGLLCITYTAAWWTLGRLCAWLGRRLGNPDER